MSMESKESGTTRPLGMCEKLFNALHLTPTFRPLRRIAYHSQEPVAVPATKPASLPPVSSAVGDGLAPPMSKSFGPEYSSGAAASARQVSEIKVPEPKLAKVESQGVMVPVKVPSKVEPLAAAAAVPGATAIPSKTFSYVEPQPPPPSRLPTERVVPSSSGKSPAPTPPPEKVVSKTDSTRANVDSMTPPTPAAEVGRTRTRRNLNDKVDEYINRTKNRLRTVSNAGGSSSTSSK